MNNVPFVPRSPAGRKIDDLARRHVRDDHDLRAAVHRALAERRGSAGPPTDDWTRPALDTRRRVSPPTQADQESDATMQPLNGTPADVPTPLQDRHWLRETLKLVAAAIVFALIGAILVLVLHDNDPDDQSSVPGAAPDPTPTVVASPTEAVVAPTAPASLTVDETATQQARQAVTRTAQADDHAATAAARDVADGIVATIGVGREPQWVAATGNAIWVANSSDGTVSRIDPTTNAVVATITVGPVGGSGSNGSPKSIVAYQEQVWVTNDAGHSLVRIDPATNQVAQTIAVPLASGAEVFWPNALVIDATGLWVTDIWGSDSNPVGRLLHIDPASGIVLAATDMALPMGVATGFGSTWVVTWDGTSADTAYRLVRVDQATHAIVAELPIGGHEAWFVATGDGSVWVSHWASSDITRIDPTTNTVIATIDSGLFTGHTIVIAESGVWVSSIFSDGVVRIDPATNTPDPAIDDDRGNSVGMAAMDGSIWVSHSRQDLVVRIEPTP